MTPEARLLRRLRDHPGQSVDQLAAACRTSTDLVLARLAEWRSLGFDILEHPSGGVHLLAVPDRLIPEDIASLLPEDQAPPRVLVFQSTASTNDLAEREALAGAPHGLVVLAETQEEGRGRLGRPWHSAPGLGLWMSILLRPVWPASRAGSLTLAAALAVADATEALCPIHTRIKWPNDVLVDGRKLAGILTETRFQDGRLSHAVVGIGINVSQGTTDFPPELRTIATSLALASTPAPRRAELAAIVWQRLAAWCAAPPDVLLAAWRDRCDTLGRQVRARCAGRLIEGTAHSVDESGSLLVRIESGSLVPILAGDIVHLT